MPSGNTDLKVIPSSREVIEHRLLTALEDGIQVAILVTRDDLNLLINALAQFGTVKGKQWCEDLRKLRHEAFGGFHQ